MNSGDWGSGSFQLVVLISPTDAYNIGAININSNLESKVPIILEYISKYLLDILVVSKVFMCNKGIPLYSMLNSFRIIFNPIKSDKKKKNIVELIKKKFSVNVGKTLFPNRLILW